MYILFIFNYWLFNIGEFIYYICEIRVSINNLNTWVYYNLKLIKKLTIIIFTLLVGLIFHINIKC